MNNTNNILYLINPYANEGKAHLAWKKARQKFPILPQTPIDITQIPNLKDFITKTNPQIIAIAGGDGTVNAVANAVRKLQQKPLLAIIPFGFGNALSYCLGVESIEKSIEVLTHEAKTVTIDVLKTNIKNHEIGVFNIGLGFDARIVYNRANFRYIGLRSYSISTVRSWVTHPEKEMRFTIDHSVTLNATASSLVIANCPVIGQNYVISPQAKLNDGLLDCTVFSTKYAYLTNLRLKGFKHPLYSELGKVHCKAKHIRIEGEPYVQIDGDSIVQKEGIEIEILPQQLTFLRNKKENIDLVYEPFK